jgi:excisionase family DNA binding protein
MGTKLLTVSEAAEALALQPCTVRSWLADGKLPFVRCGRAVRIPADAIEQFIEDNTTPAKTENAEVSAAA